MHCSNCGVENRPQARFCHDCGQRLPVEEPPKPRSNRALRVTMLSVLACLALAVCGLGGWLVWQEYGKQLTGPPVVRQPPADESEIRTEPTPEGNYVILDNGLWVHFNGARLATQEDIQLTNANRGAMPKLQAAKSGYHYVRVDVVLENPTSRWILTHKDVVCGNFVDAEGYDRGRFGGACATNVLYPVGEPFIMPPGYRVPTYMIFEQPQAIDYHGVLRYAEGELELNGPACGLNGGFSGEPPAETGDKLVYEKLGSHRVTISNFRLHEDGEYVKLYADVAIENLYGYDQNTRSDHLMPACKDTLLDADGRVLHSSGGCNLVDDGLSGTSIAPGITYRTTLQIYGGSSDRAQDSSVFYWLVIWAEPKADIDKGAAWLETQVFRFEP